MMLVLILTDNCCIFLSFIIRYTIGAFFAYICRASPWKNQGATAVFIKSNLVKMMTCVDLNKVRFF